MRALVATRKGLFAVDKVRGTWTVAMLAFVAEPVTAVLADPRSGMLHAALNLGHFGVKMHRSADGGASWQEMAAPALPDGASDTLSVSLVWSLEGGGPQHPGRLWAGTLPGALFRSDDDGANWSLVDSLWHDPRRPLWWGGGYDVPGIHSIEVDPRDNDRLALAISVGGVWHSADAGASWQLAARGMGADYLPPDQADDENQQDPHRMVRCAGAPDTLWVQHHCGIWRSRDGGRNWKGIRSTAQGGFGFAVVVHPKDPETAWFVPAIADQTRVPAGDRFVVTRTRDGGQSFETLDRGLPQGPAWDLVYRHGLDIAADGQALLMGSTTGNLWVSENGGDDWQQVSANLPPIAAVRFVDSAGAR